MSPSETAPLTDSTKPTHSHRTATSSRWTLRRRRRRLPIVQLGDKKPRRESFFVRIFRRTKLKWPTLKYQFALKNLKKYYDSFLEDIVEERRIGDSHERRLIPEASLIIPATGF